MITGEVTTYFEEVYLTEQCFLLIRLAVDRISLLKLELNAQKVVSCIINHSKAKNKISAIKSYGKSAIVVRPHYTDSAYYTIQQLKQILPTIVVKGDDSVACTNYHHDVVLFVGMATISRAVINKNEKVLRHELLVEGEGLQTVMATRGVVGTGTTSNNICEVRLYL